MAKPLPPVEVPWEMKPLESAESRIDHLPDGRFALLAPTRRPARRNASMLVWWLNNMAGEVAIEGVIVTIVSVN